MKFQCTVYLEDDEIMHGLPITTMYFVHNPPISKKMNCTVHP